MSNEQLMVTTPSQQTKQVQRSGEKEAFGVRIGWIPGVIAPPRDRVADVIGFTAHVLAAPQVSLHDTQV